MTNSYTQILRVSRKMVLQSSGTSVSLTLGIPKESLVTAAVDTPAPQNKEHSQFCLGREPAEGVRQH